MTFLSTFAFAAFAPAVIPTAAAQTRPVLEQAVVDVVYESPSVCRVTVTPTVHSAAVVHHQLVLSDGVGISDVAVRGDAALLGDPARAPRGAGLTIAVHVLAPGASSTGAARAGTATYSVSLRASGLPYFQCPVPVPDTPSTGVPGRVDLRVALPPGEYSAAGGFPNVTFDNGSTGAGSFGHVPAFVKTPFGPTAAGVSLSSLMDGIAFAAVVGSSVFWFSRRRRR